MHALLSGLLSITALAVGLRAQAQDIGLTMDAGTLPGVLGQTCGPVSCTPHNGMLVPAGQTRNVEHLGAPSSLYAIALGLPAPCTVVPGIDNVLLLQDPIILGWGLTSAPPFVPLPCQQGVAGASFFVPAGTPPGLVFRVQSLGVSNAGQLAFGPAIEASTS